MKFKLTFVFSIILIFTMIYIEQYELGIVIVFISTSIIAYGSYNIKLNFFINSIINTKNRGLSITFDDGPHPIYTQLILDTLKENDVKATFFLIGKNAEAHPEIVKRIADEGHLIGNHSYEHSNFIAFKSSKSLLSEFNRCSLVLENIINEKINIFRPPFGVTNPNYSVLIKNGMKSIGWSIRSMDTVKRDKNSFLNGLLPKLGNNEILLLHDTQKITANSIEDVILYCKNNGIKIEKLTVESH